MKNTIKRLMLRAGIDIHRVKPVFMPFVRNFQFPGSAFDFWIANPDAIWWYAEEGWRVSGEMKELARLVQRGDHVLEIGSHHGFTGLLCANFVGPSGTVVGLEAHPWNAMINSAQLGLNPGVKNLRFLHMAGSDQEGVVKMVTDNHNSSVGVSAGVRMVEVTARTGDALDKELGPFNVLKIDVEGFETKVLKGCTELLRRKPKLAIEIHIDELPKYGATVAEVFELMHLKDYEGNMVIRPDSNNVRPFVAEQMPANGIVNVFLTPR